MTAYAEVGPGNRGFATEDCGDHSNLLNCAGHERPYLFHNQSFSRPGRPVYSPDRS